MTRPNRSDITNGHVYPLHTGNVLLRGVAALRFRRQFSIRSGLIAMSVIAALLGMVVAL
jgi:hypothetical protein